MNSCDSFHLLRLVIYVVKREKYDLIETWIE